MTSGKPSKEYEKRMSDKWNNLTTRSEKGSKPDGGVEKDRR